VAILVATFFDSSKMRSQNRKLPSSRRLT